MTQELRRTCDGLPSPPRAGRALLLLIVIVTLLAAQACSGTPREDSDISGAEDEYPLRGGVSNGFSMRANVGDEFATGHLSVENVGDTPLRILEIRPEITGEGLRYLGAMFAGQDRSEGQVYLVREWPPRDPRLGTITAVPDTKLVKLPRSDPNAHSHYELLMGYRVTAEGRTTVRGVTIVYTDGATEREVTFPSMLTVCSPRTTARCKGDQDGGLYRPSEEQ